MGAIIRTLYSKTGPDGQFRFHDLVASKAAACPTEAEVRYGDVAIRAFGVKLPEQGTEVSNAAPDDFAPAHTGFVIRNPDGSFGWDSFSATEVETRQWWTNPERAAKMEALGFEVVPVVISAKE
jgi:hypothetical protein